jgi:hypothetical protein
VTNRNPLSFFIAFALIVWPFEFAKATDKANGPPSTLVTKRPGAGGTSVLGDTPLPLTVEECTKLGGAVSGFSPCGSGKACVRRDEENKQHVVCISKKN